MPLLGQRAGDQFDQMNGHHWHMAATKNCDPPFSLVLKQGQFLGQGVHPIEGRKVKQKPTGVLRFLGAAGKLLDTLVSAVRPEIVIFGLVGVLLARGRPGLRGQYVLAVMAVRYRVDQIPVGVPGSRSPVCTTTDARPSLMAVINPAMVPAVGSLSSHLFRLPSVTI